MSSWRGRRSLLDVAVAAGFAVVAEIERSVSSTNVLAGSASVAFDTFLVLVPVVPLLWRRRFPFAALVATTAALGIVGGLFHGTICFFGGLFVLLTCLYTASSYAAAPADKVAVVVPYGLYGLLPLFAGSYFQVPGDLVFATAVTVAAWLAGQGARRWRRQSHELAAALREVEAARAAHAALAVQGERTRLARELHDIVTHGLSVVVLQASRARLELTERPDEARDAIMAIESTGREALGEMRRLLGVLRSVSPSAAACDAPLADPPDLRSCLEPHSASTGGQVGGGADLEPAPSLQRLPTLIERLRRSGLDVTVAGDPGQPLPAALDLTAYRILQESLTNALRYARPPAAHVEITRREGSLGLRVTSPGGPVAGRPSGPDSLGHGHGLVGLKERAALFGGTCHAARAADGSFMVDVRLPLPGQATP